MKNIALLSFFLISINMIAQENYIEISGRVVSEKKEEAISYVNIFLCGKGIGTSTNAMGKFLLKIPSKYQNEVLCISRLGYQMQQIKLNNVPKNRGILISLKSNVAELDEVVVSDVEMPKPKVVIDKLFRKLKKNYPYKPYLLKAYYRDFLEKDGNKSHILESALGIYDPSFNYSSDELRMKLYQSKVSKGYVINYQEYYENNIGAIQGKLFISGGNQLSVLNFNNPIRNIGREAILETGYELDEDFQQHHDFVLDQFSYVGKTMLYHIEVKAKSTHPYFKKVFIGTGKKHNLEGEIWVRADNFAIQKFVYEVKIEDKLVNKTEIEYQLLDKKMYPKYLSFHNSIEIVEDEIKNTYMHHRELFINEVKLENIPSPDTFQLFDAIDAFHQSDYMSNQRFWNQYNTIKLEDE